MSHHARGEPLPGVSACEKPSNAVEIAAAEETAKDEARKKQQQQQLRLPLLPRPLAALLHPSRSSASLPTSTATDAVVRAVSAALPPGRSGGDEGSGGAAR